MMGPCACCSGKQRTEDKKVIDYEAESFPRGFETMSWILPEPRTVPVSVKARECLSGSDLNLECG